MTKDVASVAWSRQILCGAPVDPLCDSCMSSCNHPIDTRLCGVNSYLCLQRYLVIFMLYLLSNLEKPYKDTNIFLYHGWGPNLNRVAKKIFSPRITRRPSESQLWEAPDGIRRTDFWTVWPGGQWLSWVAKVTWLPKLFNTSR